MLKKLMCITLGAIMHLTCNSQSIKPILNLSKGKTYFLNVVTSSDVKQNVSEQQTNLNSQIAYKMSFKVMGKRDSLYTMDVRYLSLNLQIISKGKKIVISSDLTGVQDASSTILGAIVNKTFNIVMSTNGKVKSVKNVGKIISDAIESNPHLTAVQKSQLEKQMSQSFGEETLKNNLEALTAIYPDKPISRNKSWAVKNGFQTGFAENMLTTYRLATPKGNFYNIKGRSAITTDKKSLIGPASGIRVKYDLNGSGSKTIKTDKKTGWIISSYSTHTLKGNVLILPTTQIPAGASIPMTVNTTTVTKNY